MANPISVVNATITVQAYSEAGVLVGTAVNLCGANSITWEVGTPDEVDVTDFCDTSRVMESGMLGEGTLDITYVKYDPKDVGQALIDSSPLNTRLQVIVKFKAGDSFTFETRKKQSTSGSITLADIVVSGAHQLALIGEHEYTPVAP